MFSRAIAASCIIAGTASIALADSPIDVVPVIDIPTIDFHAVEVEDAAREAAGLAPRYAIPHEVALTPATSGLWEVRADGTMLWRLRIESPLAASINLGFQRWTLPSTATMTVGTSDGFTALRPFTAADNQHHR